jgi:plastocyanin
MRFRAALAPAALAVSVAVLASCGGSDSGSTGTTVPADLTVTAIDGIAWDSADYTATAGEVTVAVVNDSSLPHNLHIVDAEGTQLPDVFDIPTKGDVDSDTITLAAGTYTLICTIPGHANMKSTLTVN